MSEVSICVVRLSLVGICCVVPESQRRFRHFPALLVKKLEVKCPKLSKIFL